MPQASFEVDVVSGVPVVATPDEIDIANAAELRAALLEASASMSTTLVVDMSKTEFCDSSGIHVLLGAHNRAHAEGRELMLVLPATTVLRTFAVTGVDRVIPNFSCLHEALEYAASMRSAATSAALTGSEPASSGSAE